MDKKSISIAAACGVGLVLIIGALAFFKGSGAPSTGLLKVVAAENVWGDIAAQIGGPRVQVTSVISDPATDPHLYESGAKDASNITSADVVIINGLGYDEFMTKVLDGAPNPNRAVVVAADAIKLKDGDNPHTWYDIARINVAATQIKKQFATKDPAGAGQYQQNLDAFLISMRPLYDELNGIRAKYAGAPVAYTERLPGYLLDAANLNVLTPPSFAAAIEDGNEPSPGDQTAMLNLITGKQIRALLYNTQANSPATQNIRDKAAASGIPVVNITETLPAGLTYQAWQKAQLDALKDALEVAP